MLQKLRNLSGDCDCVSLIREKNQDRELMRFISGWVDDDVVVLEQFALTLWMPKRDFFHHKSNKIS